MKFVAFAAAAVVGSMVCGSASAATLMFQVTIDTKDVYQREVKNEVTKTDKTKTTHPSQTFNITITTEDFFGIDNSSYTDATSAAWRNEAHPGVLSSTALPFADELITLAGGTLGAAEMSAYLKAADDYYEPPYSLPTLVHRTENAGFDWQRNRDAYAETEHTVSNDFGSYYYSMSYDSLMSPPAYDPRTFTSAQLLELFEGETFSFAAVGFAGSYLYTDGYTNSDIFKSTTYSGVAKLVSVEVATAAVPEPATWALMIGGFGLAGAMLRRRRVLAA